MNDLNRLFHEAVDPVEPNPGLDAIRARISEEPAMNRRWIAPLAAAAAVAAIAGGFLALQDGDPQGGPVTPPATSTPVSPTPTPTETEPPVKQVAVPVYYVGDTPQGPRLYREFARVPEGQELQAVDLAVAGKAADPDYRSPWPAGTKLEISFDGVGEDGQFGITLPDASLHDRPAGMSAREAALAIEQVIYTAQGVAQTRAPVQFYLGNNPIDTVLGVPTSEPLANGPVVETLSLVNLSTPGEGQVVTGDTLAVSGVANSFEATVPLRLQRYEGTQIVWQGSAMASECCGDKLYPFSTSIDVSEVPPGRYLLTASTDDPSDGEGPGPFTDTRLIEIR